MLSSHTTMDVIEIPGLEHTKSYALDCPTQIPETILKTASEYSVFYISYNYCVVQITTDLYFMYSCSVMLFIVPLKHTAPKAYSKILNIGFIYINKLSGKDTHDTIFW